MKELRFENLYSPEYYLEIPNYDSRIAIMKFLDTRDTMGMAAFSLSYIDIEPTDDTAKIVARTIHIRHAIEDLNNSFDLLMQVPWFFYRIWNEYNSKGSLKTNTLKNHNEIIRGSYDWVIKAEKECSKKKVVKYLEFVSNPIKSKIEQFWNDYILNNKKQFTVRTLCNKMKHNRALAFEELYEPYEFNLNIDGQTKNLRQSGLSAKFSQNILDNNKELIGQIKYKYLDDLSIDIEYTNGDVFEFKDCSHANKQLRISDVYTECCNFFDALVDLFEDVYNEIYPNIYLLPAFQSENGKPNIKPSNDKIDLNKYFLMS